MHARDTCGVLQESTPARREILSEDPDRPRVELNSQLPRERDLGVVQVGVGLDVERRAVGTEGIRSQESGKPGGRGDFELKVLARAILSPDRGFGSLCKDEGNEKQAGK